MNTLQRKVVLTFPLSDNPAIMSDGRLYQTAAQVTLYDNRDGYIDIAGTRDDNIACHFYWHISDDGKMVVCSDSWRDSWRVDVAYLSERVLSAFKAQMMELITE